MSEKDVDEIRLDVEFPAGIIPCPQVEVICVKCGHRVTVTTDAHEFLVFPGGALCDREGCPQAPRLEYETRSW